jgi:thiamine-monophosphate kinase
MPRLDVVRALSRTKHVRGAIDVSDGLSSDLIHLCRAGRVGCEIDAGALPIGRGVRAFCRERGVDAVDWTLRGGEDYALILSVPLTSLNAVERRLRAARVRAVVVGRFTRSRGTYRIVGTSSRSRAFHPGGWDHRRKAGL